MNWLFSKDTETHLRLLADIDRVFYFHWEPLPPSENIFEFYTDCFAFCAEKQWYVTENYEPILHQSVYGCNPTLFGDSWECKGIPTPQPKIVYIPRDCLVWEINRVYPTQKPPKASRRTNVSKRGVRPRGRRSLIKKTIKKGHKRSTKFNPRPTKNFWTLKEDRQLLQQIKTENPTNWKQIAACILRKSPKQARERYLNHLHPKLSHQKWGAKEDARIIKWVQKVGRKWEFISTQMLDDKKHHWSGNSLKNKYNALLNKRNKG